MIIIEGPDNSGKSTLGAQLSRDLDIPLLHSVRPDPHWNEHACLRHSRDQLAPKNAILDRVYAISEPIYGPICRGKSSLGMNAEPAILDLMNRNHLIIYCRPHDQVILRNAGREQMEGVLENHQAIIQAYDQVFEDLSGQHSGTVVYYDWKIKTMYPALLKTCQDHMKSFNSKRSSAAYLARFK